MHTHEAEFSLGTLLRLGARDTRKIENRDFEYNKYPARNAETFFTDDPKPVEPEYEYRVDGACARAAIGLAGAYLHASQEGDPRNAGDKTSIDVPRSVMGVICKSILVEDIPDGVPIKRGCRDITVNNLVVGLNDRYSWSRERIADLLDVLTERDLIPTVTLPVRLDRLQKYKKTDWLDEAEHVAPRQQTVDVDEGMPSGDSVPEANPELAVADEAA